MNATLIGHTLGKHADISASVYNLLNKKYSFPGRPEDPEDAILQDGTTFPRQTNVSLESGEEHGKIAIQRRAR